MNARTMLILAVACLTGLAVVRWRQQTADATAPMASEPVEITNAASVHDSQNRREQSEANRPPERMAEGAGVPRIMSDEALVRIAMEIRQALASTNAETREHALTSLLPALVSHDAPTAARLAESTPSGEARVEALRCVARFWAAQDAVGALAWAGSRPDAGERDAVVTDVCLKVAEENPAEAVRMRERFVPDAQPDVALENLAQQWAETDLSAALAWAAAHPAGEERDQLLARIAFVQSQTAPRDAARLAVEQIPPGEAQNECVISVLHQWAMRDAGAATAWVESFPEGALRGRALQELTGIANTRMDAP